MAEAKAGIIIEFGEVQKFKNDGQTILNIIDEITGKSEQLEETSEKVAEAVVKPIETTKKVAEESAAAIDETDKAFDEMAEHSEASAGTFRDNLVAALGVVGAGIAALITAALELNAAIIGVVNEVAEGAADTAAAAQELDFGTQAYQEWAYVLERSRSSITRASSAIQNLTKVSRNASDDQAAAFEALGLSMETVSQMRPEALFETVVRGLQGIEDSGERAALASTLFGNGYKSLGTLLSASAEETDALRQKAQDLGLVLSEDMIKSSQEYQDNLEEIQGIVQGIENAFSSELIEEVSAFRAELVKMLEEVNWADLARDLASIVGPAMDFINELILPLARNSIAGAVSWLGKLVVVIRELEAVLGGEQSLGDALEHIYNSNNPNRPEAVFQDAPQTAQGIETVANALKTLQASWIDTEGMDFGNFDPNAQSLEAFNAEFAQFIQNTAAAMGDAEMADARTQAWAEAMWGLADAVSTFATENSNAWGDESLRQAFLEDVTRGTAAYRDAMQATEESPAGDLEAQAESAGAAVQVLTETGQTLATNSEQMLQEFSSTAGEIQTEFVQGTDEMSQAAVAAVESTNSAMETNMAILSANATVWGSDMMQSLAAGILQGAIDYVVPAIDSVAGDITDRIGFSEPEIGPLSRFHTFAPDMMALFAQGIREGRSLLSDAIGESFDLGPMIAGQNAGRTLNYGGVSVAIYAAPGQSADELYDVFTYRLQRDVADREAVFSA